MLPPHFQTKPQINFESPVSSTYFKPGPTLIERPLGEDSESIENKRIHMSKINAAPANS